MLCRQTARSSFGSRLPPDQPGWWPPRGFEPLDPSTARPHGTLDSAVIRAVSVEDGLMGAAAPARPVRPAPALPQPAEHGLSMAFMSATLPGGTWRICSGASRASTGSWISTRRCAGSRLIRRLPSGEAAQGQSARARSPGTAALPQSVAPRADEGAAAGTSGHRALARPRGAASSLPKPRV